MMNNHLKYTLLVGLVVCALGSCKEQELLIPPASDLTNGDKIDVIAKPTDVQISGSYDRIFTFSWPAFSDKIEKVKVSYMDAGVAKEFTVTDFSKEYQLVTNTFGSFDFKLTGIAKDGRETEVVTKKATNQDLYVKEIIQFTTASAEALNVIATWTNPATVALQVAITYEAATGTKTDKITTSEIGGELIFSGLYGNAYTIAITDAAGNTESKRFTYNVVAIDLTQKAVKAAWTAVVSSNHVGDGGGAPALIDANPDTFWHSPWGGTILPWPHWASITFDNKKALTDLIIKLRHNNGSGAPKEFDLQTSQDGVTFTTVQSFVNTSVTAGAVISYKLSSPVTTKYARLLFRTSINNLAYMSLGEIDFYAKGVVVD